MMYALTHATFYTGEDCLTQHAVVIKDDRIIDVLPEAKLDPNIERIDLKGAIVAPGFIDLQLNGCGGVLFNDDISESALATMHQTNLRSGTTSFLPTLITTSDEDMQTAITVTGRAMSQYPSNILGLHLEGPYINPIKKGIHNPEFIRKPNPEMLNIILEDNAQTVKLLTLAPEMVETKTIKALADCGIIVSCGHSFATYEQARQGFAAGISMATHLFNTMSQLESRSPGIVGAVLEEDCYASVIVDGMHVDYSVLRLAKKLKGDRLVLITDAATPVGTEDMDSFMFGGQKVLYKNGQCITPEGTLGGSALTMIAAVKNSVEHLDIPLDEALRMASTYPAIIIGMDNVLGKIGKQFIANIVVLDQSLGVKAVVSNGQFQSVS